MKSATIALFLVAATLAGAPIAAAAQSAGAAAAAAPDAYKPAGQWTADYGDDYCRLARNFSDGTNTMALALERIQPGPDMRLIFVGPDLGIAGDDGVTRRFEACRTMWLRERADRVDYRGALPPAAICRLRAESFATIVASRWENQSYTMLEAMLQGCPIVSSDAGGHSESVRHEETGLLATAGDPESLAARLATLLDHPDRAAALGARARAHVLEHHSPDRVVEQMLGVYEQTIALAQRTAASPHAAAAT